MKRRYVVQTWARGRNERWALFEISWMDDDFKFWTLERAIEYARNYTKRIHVRTRVINVIQEISNDE